MSEAKNIVSDKHSIALVLIDVINHLDFEGNEGLTFLTQKMKIRLFFVIELIKVIKPIGERIAELKKAACSVNIPVPHVKYMVKMVETK
jgi:nicotinamidase-related amidase